MELSTNQLEKFQRNNNFAKCQHRFVECKKFCIYRRWVCKKLDEAGTDKDTNVGN